MALEMLPAEGMRGAVCACDGQLHGAVSRSAPDHRSSTCSLVMASFSCRQTCSGQAIQRRPTDSNLRLQSKYIARQLGRAQTSASIQQ